jgi:hypothetical protein
MSDNATYIEEIEREVYMREKVYPGLVKAGKMTQVDADRKTALIANIARLFEYAEHFDMPATEITLPFHPPGITFHTTTLAPQIHEIEKEIVQRIRRINRLHPSTSTYEIAIYQLQLMREILSIIRHIQNTHNAAQAQLNLFPT